jgi:uncharacterized membrane protein (UPF0127 family)
MRARACNRIAWRAAALALLLAAAGCEDESEPGGVEPPPEPEGPRVRIASGTWRVRLARDDESRTKGLGGVTYLPEDEGMLFLFERAEADRAFWMKDCRIPLDICFLDADRRVVQVATLPAPPPGTPRHRIPRVECPEPTKYVLEVRAGALGRAGVGVGNVAKFVNIP